MSPLKQGRQFTLLSYHRSRAGLTKLGLQRAHLFRNRCQGTIPNTIRENLILTTIGHRPGRCKLWHQPVPDKLPRLRTNLPQQPHLRPGQLRLLLRQAPAKLVRLPLSLVKQQCESKFSWIV